MEKYVDYVQSETDCTSDDTRYSGGSRAFGSVRYSLRMARASRENGLRDRAARYLEGARKCRLAMIELKEAGRR